MATNILQLRDIEALTRKVQALEMLVVKREGELQSLRVERSRQRQALQASKITLWYWSGESRQTVYIPEGIAVHRAAELPSDSNSVREEDLLFSIHPDDHEYVMDAWEQAAYETQPYAVEYRLMTVGGEMRHVRETAEVEYDGAGRYVAHVGATQDITERKQAEDALIKAHNELEQVVHTRTQSLHRANARLKDFAEIAVDWFWETDGGRNLTYLSGRDEQIIGIAVEQALGKQHDESFVKVVQKDSEQWSKHLTDLDMRRPFADCKIEQKCRDGTTKVLLISGKPLYDEPGAFVGYRGVGRDGTEADTLSRQLSYQVTHDSLTGLVSRFEFERRLKRVLATARKEHTENVLCFLDLDMFKVVNDTCGHVAGDELLRQIGRLCRNM